MAKEIQVIHMNGTQVEREAISGATDKIIIWHEPDGTTYQSHATGWTQTHAAGGVPLVSMGGPSGSDPVLITSGVMAFDTNGTTPLRTIYPDVNGTSNYIYDANSALLSMDTVDTGDTFRMTFTRTNGLVTAISGWVKQ